MRHRAWIGGVVLALALSALVGTGRAQTAGRHEFVVAGFASASAVNPADEPSSFGATFNPIFLWRIDERLFFESEVEFELEADATEVGLEYAQIWYTAADWLSLGAGRLLNPNNVFMERLHPSWINRLPDMPMGLTGHAAVALIASTQVGVQARGAFDVGSAQVTWSAFVANGPSIHIDEGDSTAVVPDRFARDALGGPARTASAEEGHHGAGATGTLSWGGAEDNNGDKAVGGRLAVLPVAGLELGYGVETAKVGSGDLADLREVTQSVDLALSRDVRPLGGHLDVRGQWVWLSIDAADVPPLDYANDSNGGYVQLAYRPTHAPSQALRNLEIVGRYDRIDLPDSAEVNEDQWRVTGGLDYWLSSSTVLKAAFERQTTRHADGDEVSENRWLAQFAMGF